MMRTMIQIDQEKCIGCGLCANSCAQGAIGMQDGKAVLLREDYCDGLGKCLPVCPVGAISFSEREILRKDTAAPSPAEPVSAPKPIACGCPGTMARSMERPDSPPPRTDGCCSGGSEESPSELRQWPVQIQLVPPHAPYLQGANLLVAADCTAFAYGRFHADFMRGRVTLIGCPKLDHADYSERLTEVLRANELESITVLRMEVPCCGGLVQAVKGALAASGKQIPWQIVTISTDGRVLA